MERQASWQGRAAALALSLCGVASVGAAPTKAEAQTRRVDLRVLVISAGDVGTAMIKAGLDEGMVPYTEIDLTKAGRQVINAAFLADTQSVSTRRAK